MKSGDNLRHPAAFDATAVLLALERQRLECNRMAFKDNRLPISIRRIVLGNVNPCAESVAS